MGNTLKYEAMELSPLEKSIIMESWLSLRRKLSLCGQTLVLTFLEDYPQHLVHFSPKYRGNPDLAEVLGLKIMREFSRIVSNLETLSSIASYMREVAENHQPRHINPQAFDDFRHSFLKMLKKQMPNHKHLSLYLHCWDKLIKLVNRIVLDIMNDIDKKAPQSQFTLAEQPGQIQIIPKKFEAAAPPPPPASDEASSTQTHIKYNYSIDEF